MTDHNAFPSVVSGQEATFSKVGPLIKTSAFTSLIEQEVAQMRTFLDPNDAAIEDNEVFFYMPNTGGAKDIEGDQMTGTPDFNNANNDYKQPSEAAGKFGTLGRRAEGSLRQNDARGIIEHVREVEPGARVMWKNATGSPVALELVEVELR